MIDPDSYTVLDFETVDSEPTGLAESLAWSGEIEQQADPSPRGNGLVIGAVVLSAVAMICSTITAVVLFQSAPSVPTIVPITSTVTAPPVTVTPPPPPPPPVTSTVTPPPVTSTKTVAPNPSPAPEGSIGHPCGPWNATKWSDMDGQLVCNSSGVWVQAEY